MSTSSLTDLAPGKSVFQSSVFSVLAWAQSHPSKRHAHPVHCLLVVHPHTHTQATHTRSLSVDMSSKRLDIRRSLLVFVSRLRREHIATFVVGFCVASLLPSPAPHYHLQVLTPADSRCSEIVPRWIWNLHRHENRLYSMGGEDGITEQLIRNIRPVGKYFVEFGTESGVQCNTRILRQRYGWKGLLMDGRHQNTTIGLYKEQIHPDNVVDLFRKHQVPREPDYLSEDTDYSDWWIWKAILEAGYRPKIVVGEINSNFQPSESATVHAPPKNKVRFWEDLSNYFGTSARALKRLWNKHGYTMVYCSFDQTNCWGVRTDLLKLGTNASAGAVQECLWRKPLSYHRKLHGKDVSKEKFSWVNEDGNVVSDNYVASFTETDFVQWQIQTDPTFNQN